MKSNYIVKRKNHIMLSYFYDGENICENAYYNNHWTGAKKIITKTLSSFSLTIGHDEKIYIFCQDLEGNIILCMKNDENWQKKIIMENTAKSVYSIKLVPFLTETGIYLFYSLPNEGNGQQIVFQKSTKGQWASPVVIDSFEPFSSSPFTVQKISSSHLILYYQKRNPETNIGYREISLNANKIGDFKIFHTTNYMCGDECFLTTEEAIHALYIIRGMFSQQLVYKYKRGEKFSGPQILWDGQRIVQCVLLMIEGKLFALWQMGNQMYYSICEDNEFPKPVRYRGSMDSHLLKAFYVTETEQKDSGFIADQIYVDYENPSDVAIIPDLYPLFYPEKMISKQSNIKTPTPEAKTPFVKKEPAYNKTSNKIHMYQQQIKEKDNQILQYVNLMRSRNEEMVAADMEWKQKIKLLSEENESLKQNAALLKERTENAEQKNKNLKEELENKIKKIEALEEEIRNTRYEEEPWEEMNETSPIEEAKEEESFSNAPN